MRECCIDTETRSAVPIQHGNDRYTRAAECMIVTYTLDDEPTKIWDATNQLEMPADLDAILDDPDILLTAASAKFDRGIIRHALKRHTDLKRWRCTQAQAYAHGLPGSLELQGIVLNIGAEHQKLDTGKNLIPTFCIPMANGKFIQPWDKPDDWQTFCDYAVRDADALREIRRKLPSHNYTGDAIDLWHLDQRINERGFQFDDKLATAARAFLKIAKDKSDVDLTQATGGVVQAATQRARLLNYLNEKYKLDIPNLRAAEIRSMLEQDDLSPEVRFLLESRLEYGKSSGAKYTRGLNMVGPQGRMRQTIQYSGAGRTGRSSGRGFQPHNMTRPIMTIRNPVTGRIDLVPIDANYIDEVVIPGIYSKQALDNKLIYGGPNEAAALAMRHVITAALGNVLTVADWKNIESRVLAWIADEKWKLIAYEAADRGEGDDLYKLLFSQFFGTAVADVNDTERQSGKVSELAFGFGGGVGALVTMAAGYQMDLDPLAAIVLPRATPEQLKKAEKAWRRAFLLNEDYALEPAVYKACDVLKQTYRESNAAIDKLKHDIDAATKTAIKEPGRAFTVGRCKIWAPRGWLIIELPSGRRLLYANPRVEYERSTDPDSGKETQRAYITYATARGKTWRRERAWSGLFVENIVQAIANDVLRGALLRVDAETLKIPAVQAYLATLPEDERTAISLHVHDEVVLDLPPGAVTLKQLVGWMTAPFTWSAGLPLAAEGWTGFRYGKRKAK